MIQTHEYQVTISLGFKQDILTPPPPLQHGILLVMQTVGHLWIGSVMQ
jgi:hypothetical protein